MIQLYHNYTALWWESQEEKAKMKKALKIIGIVLLVIIGLVVIWIIVASLKQAVDKKYTQTVKTGGDIEAKYLAMGSHETSYLERGGMHDFKKYEIFYPSDIDSGNEKYPVVIFSNGTGIKTSKYKAVLEHLASWGFVCIGTEEENSWNGFSSEMCLRFIEKLNATETVDGWDKNPFYGHIDMDNIGVSGHSQGGVGVINAATENKNGSKIKAIFSASPTNKELAAALEWDYDASLVSVPIFLVSSTGNSDENLVVSGEQLKAIYDDVPDAVTKIMARRNDADHGDMLSFADGYMTAWFMWQLQGDEEAAKAFTGDSPEIKTNSLYQDQQFNIK